MAAAKPVSRVTMLASRLAMFPIPFASPRLLWRMKTVTHREKDDGDLVFLRYWFNEQGKAPQINPFLAIHRLETIV